MTEGSTRGRGAEEKNTDALDDDPAGRLDEPPAPDDDRLAAMVRARLFPSLAAPPRIGRYNVLDKLGQGGMGIVYAAFDSELDRRVAIKLLRGPSGDSQGDARLLREAKAMARVVHPNVISVIEVGQHEGSTFVVMEHLRGQTLNHWIADAPGWRATLGVFVQAARGLAAAHRAGVVHRDFKPHNVMIVEGGVDDGRVKVLDFGLARDDVGGVGTVEDAPSASSDALAALTRTGAMMGTPVYMAPEQYEGETASPRSDQYSFAVSLYQGLFGELPYTADSLEELSQSVREGARPRPPRTREVPPWLRRAVLRGLQRAPAERYPSMDAFVAALEADPTLRRRRALIGVTLVAGASSTAWVLARAGVDDAPPCQGPAFQLDDLWDRDRENRLAAVFAASGRAFAADTADRVATRLESYASEWTEMRQQACLAHQRGVQSSALLDLRMACLDLRRASFAALVELMLNPDGVTVEKALEAASRLPSLDRCADTAALSSGLPLPEEPTRAHAITTLRRELARARVLDNAGQHHEALQLARAARTEADPLEYPPLSAEIALVVGVAHQGLYQGDDADQELSAAYALALAHHADSLATEALARRIFVRSAILSDPTRASHDEETARALAERLGDGATRWLVLNNLGTVYHAGGDHDRARALYEQAYAIERGPTVLDRAYTQANLGLLLFEQGRSDAATAAYAAAQSQLEAAFGPDHPVLAPVLSNSAFALEDVGQRAAARALLERVLAIHDDAGAGETAVIVWPLVKLSGLDLHRRHYARALDRAERALRVLGDERSAPLQLANARVVKANALASLARNDESRALFDETLRFVAASLRDSIPTQITFLRSSALCSLARGEPERALSELERARALAINLSDPPIIAALHVTTARAQLALGDLDAARADALQGLALYRDALGPDALDIGRAAHVLAEIHDARGSRPLARAAYEQALRVYEARLDPDDPDLALLRRAYALSLLQGSASQEPPPRARELADPALAAFTSLGPAFDPERLSLHDALRGRPSDP